MSEDAVHVTGLGLALAGVEGAEDLLRPDGPANTDPVDPAARIGRKGLRYKDRATQLALTAGLDALRDAGLVARDGEACEAGASTGVVASSNLGNLEGACRIAEDIAEHSVAGISPMNLPNASSNVVASSVGIRFGLRGPNLMVCNGASSGLDAVRWGAGLVTAGRAQHVLVVGVETSNAVTARLGGYPAEEGFDGAVALVLENATATRRRDASSLAVLGPHTRGRSVAECVGSLLGRDAEAAGPAGQAAAGGTAPGIWFTPERWNAAAPVAGTDGMVRRDMTRTFGRASGALGVLQCAAAASWCGLREPAAALLTCGDDTSDGVAGMVLRTSGGPR